MRGRSSGSFRRLRSGTGPRLLLLLLALPATARAAVTEPPIPPSTMGIAVPQPSPSVELSVVTSRGFTMMDGTLPGLFTSRGEVIDPVKDAQTAPGTFSPHCGFTVRIVLEAGSCPMGVGWYNVISGSTTPPPADQIYMFIPATFPRCPASPATLDPATACCDDSDFCPLATYDTTQMPQHRWNMPAYAMGGIVDDPHYLGGMVGLVLIGAASSSYCSQNKYSQLGLNATAPNGQPWVGALIYQSTVNPRSYYLAFETAPTSASSWRGSLNGDGDFNDYVLYLDGASCDDGSMGGATGTAGSGGAAGVGGDGMGAGGKSGNGGSLATGGSAAAGGKAGTGGNAAAGGSPATGGSAATGGTPATGGGTVTGGSGGAVAAASGGGTLAPDGSGGAAGGASGGAAGVTVPGTRSGCSCDAAPGARTRGALAGGLMLLLPLRRRRQRRCSAGSIAKHGRGGPSRLATHEVTDLQARRTLSQRLLPLAAKRGLEAGGQGGVAVVVRPFFVGETSLDTSVDLQRRSAKLPAAPARLGPAPYRTFFKNRPV